MYSNDYILITLSNLCEYRNWFKLGQYIGKHSPCAGLGEGQTNFKSKNTIILPTNTKSKEQTIPQTPSK